MNARQQAEEAIYSVWFARLPNSTHKRYQQVKELADAAANVWEPLLRALVDGEPVADINDCGYNTCIYCMEDQPPRRSSDRPEDPEVFMEWLNPPVVHKDTCPWLVAKKALDG